MIRPSAVLAIALGMIPGHAAAQVRIPDAVTCERCRVAVQPLFTIGELDGPGALASQGQVAVDGQGRFWVTQGSLPPLVFDSAGRYVRTLGSRGQGPNEYVSVNLVIPLPGDSMLVFDNGARRAVVVGPGFIGVRYILVAVPVSNAIVVDWPRTVVIYSNIRTPDLIGLPLHTVSMAGPTATLTSSLREIEVPVIPGRIGPNYRLASTWDHRGFWSLEARSYRLSRWTHGGQRSADYVRVSPWFDGEPGLLTPQALGLIETERDVVWSYVNVPRSDAGARMREAVAPSLPPQGGGGAVEIASSSLPSTDQLFETVLEVIDVAGQSVVVRQALGMTLVAMLPDGRAIAYTEADGIPKFVVVQLRLETGL